MQAPDSRSHNRILLSLAQLAAIESSGETAHPKMEPVTPVSIFFASLALKVMVSGADFPMMVPKMSAQTA